MALDFSTSIGTSVETLNLETPAKELLQLGSIKTAILHTTHLAAAAAVLARHALAAGQEALRLSAASEAVAHLDNARQLAEEAAQGGTMAGSIFGDLYLQLGQAYGMNNQHGQAQAVHDEWQRLRLKQS